MKKIINFLRDNPLFDFLLALGLIQTGLVAVKLLGKTTWRWLWVLTPTWIFVLVCALLVILCIFCLVDDLDSEAGDV